MNNNQAVQAINTQAIVRSFTQAELDTLKSTVAKGTTDEQFALFVQTCINSGLDPFLKQIHCIVYDGKNGPTMSIQIAVEGIIALAKRHEHYRGFIASEVKENDEFEIDMVTGEPKHKVNTLVRGKTVGAYCVAYREGAPNIAVVVTSDQVEHLVRGGNGQIWKNYFDDMIVKHAIKRAFKRQFGIEVVEDEQVQPSSIENMKSYEQPVRRDITAEAEIISSEQPAIEKPKDDGIKAIRKKITAAFKKLGITDPTAMAEYTAQRMKQKGDKPTLQELTGLLKVMEMEIEEQAAMAEVADGLEPLE